MRGAIEYSPTSLSVEQFEALPMDDDYKYELSAALLIREPRPGPRHGSLHARLVHRLHGWVESGGGGLVLVDTSFVLAYDPPIVRAPDIAWVARADTSRLDAPSWPGAPDLAIEILSPWDRASAVREKVGQYLAAGVRLTWIVDPPRRTVVVHDASGEVLSVDDRGSLDGGEVLRGFTLPVADLFPIQR